MAGSTGLEPAASGVTGRRSNQLNYDPNGAITQLLNGGIRELVDCIHQLADFPKSSTARHQPVVGGTGLEPVTAGV